MNELDLPILRSRVFRLLIDFEVGEHVLHVTGYLSVGSDGWKGSGMRGDLLDGAELWIDQPTLKIWTHTDEGSLITQARSQDYSVIVLGLIYSSLADDMPAHPLQASHVLHLVHQVGKEVLQSLQGSFVILLYDHQRDMLCAISDGSRQRRLYVVRSGESLWFSSRLRIVSALSGEGSPNDRSQSFFLTYGFFPGNETVYGGIESIPPGQMVGLGSGGVVKAESNSDGHSLVDAGSGENPVDALYQLLIRIVEAHSAGHERVAVLLGGFDSALVASLLVRCGKQVETYSFGYDDKRYEQPLTDRLAGLLGIRHHFVKITPDVIRDGLHAYAEYFDQPSNWPNYIVQTAYLCRVIRNDGFGICFTGDGCDSLFLGYPGVYRNSQLYARMGQMPKALERVLLRSMDSLILENHFGHIYRLAARFIRNSAAGMPERAYLMSRVLDEMTIGHVTGRSAADIEREVSAVKAVVLEAIPSELSPARLAFLGKSASSPNRTKLVGSSDGSGLILFSPYMHPLLSKMISKLPEEYLRPRNSESLSDIGKYVLTQVARLHGLLPEEIIFQKKIAAVDAPIDEWYYGPLKKDIRDILAFLPFEANERAVKGFLKPSWATELYKRRWSSDSLTTHAVSLLTTYASYFRFSDAGVR